jgi:CheY-like chemotaxis protein
MKTLPIRTAKRNFWDLFMRERKAPEAAPLTASPAAPAKGKTILIVDDDAIVRRTAAEKLQAAGYTVCTAADGAKGLNLVREKAPDLILMDVTLPPDVGAVPWDGFLVISWLRRFEQGRNVPIIVITSSPSEQTRARAKAAGAIGFFAKPLDHVQLLELIERTQAGTSASTEAGATPEFEI